MTGELLLLVCWAVTIAAVFAGDTRWTLRLLCVALGLMIAGMLSVLRLVVATRRGTVLWVLYFGLLLGVLGVTARQALADPPNQPPRLVVLMLGDDVDMTNRPPMPELEALILQGVTYDRVVSPSTVCRPALVPWLWPGVTPWEAGIKNLDSPAAAPLLASIFRRAIELGYHPIGAGKFWEPQPAIHDPLYYGAEWWFDAGCPEHDPPMQFARQTVQPLVDEANRRLARGEKVLVVTTPMLPHQPRDAGQEYLDRVLDEWIPPCPPWVADPMRYVTETRKFYANHLRLDDAIGELRRGLLKDAAWVIGWTDNGLTTSSRSRQFSKQGPYGGGFWTSCTMVAPGVRHGTVDSRLTTSLECGGLAVDLMRGVRAPEPRARRSAMVMTYARGGQSWPVDEPMAATLVRSDGWSAVLQLATWRRIDELSGDVTWKHEGVALPPDPVRTEGALELYAPGDRWQDSDVAAWYPATAESMLADILRRMP